MNITPSTATVNTTVTNNNNVKRLIPFGSTMEMENDRQPTMKRDLTLSLMSKQNVLIRSIN
jgi:hypothetical protein